MNTSRSNKSRRERGKKAGENFLEKKKKKNLKEYRTPIYTATTLMPDKVAVDLDLFDEFRLSGAASVAKRYITNGAFDPDPVLGGPSLAGFSLWSQFYSYNRVVSFRIMAELSNLEVYPVTCFFCHLNVDPTTSPIAYPAFAQQAYGYIKQLGPATGKSDFTYTKVLTPRHIVGDKLTSTSERYVGSSAANPADLTYFGMSVSDSIASLPNGVKVVYRVRYRVEFFDRKNIQDSIFQKQQEKDTPPRFKEKEKSTQLSDALKIPPKQ